VLRRGEIGEVEEMGMKRGVCVFRRYSTVVFLLTCGLYYVRMDGQRFDTELPGAMPGPGQCPLS
jgi:hypothetical protein